MPPPACEAVTEHVPATRRLSIDPFTTHAFGVLETYVMGKPDEVVAERTIGSLPAETSGCAQLMVCGILTITGMTLMPPFALPSSAEVFDPQHLVVPSFNNAQLYHPPAATSTTPAKAYTLTGYDLLTVVLSPSSPS